MPAVGREGNVNDRAADLPFGRLPLVPAGPQTITRPSCPPDASILPSAEYASASTAFGCPSPASGGRKLPEGVEPSSGAYAPRSPAGASFYRPLPELVVPRPEDLALLNAVNPIARQPSSGCSLKPIFDADQRLFIDSANCLRRKDFDRHSQPGREIVLDQLDVSWLMNRVQPDAVLKVQHRADATKQFTTISQSQSGRTPFRFRRGASPRSSKSDFTSVSTSAFTSALNSFMHCPPTAGRRNRPASATSLASCPSAQTNQHLEATATAIRTRLRASGYSHTSPATSGGTRYRSSHTISA